MAEESDNSSPLQEASKEVTAAVESVTEQAKDQVEKKPWLKWAGGGALVLIILLLAFGFRKTTAPAKQWQEYYSDTLGFSLSHPANWIVTEADAASGPDILIAEQGGSAFVRIRGFLDSNLNSSEAIQTSLDDYQKMLALQPSTQIADFTMEKTIDQVTEFTLSGEFLVDDTAHTFVERGMLSTTGRVLLLRSSDIAEKFSGSLPTMNTIADSFTLGQPTTEALGIIPTVWAADEPSRPLASLGDVKFNITDHQANEVDVADSYAKQYESFLQGNIVNAGVPLGVTGSRREQVLQAREENNQLNGGQGGRHLITNASGETFWGYKKITGDLPEANFQIDASINVFNRDAGGNTQDLSVSVRIYDKRTNQLIGTAQANRENTQRIQNQQYVGGQPNWWQRNISGYAQEITYEDVLRTIISEATTEATKTLSALQEGTIVSDADRFTQSLAESGYKPIVPDEIRQQSEGYPKSADASWPRAYPHGVISLDEQVQGQSARCPYSIDLTIQDGTRATICGRSESEVDQGGLDFSAGRLKLITTDDAQENLETSLPNQDLPRLDSYSDASLEAYNEWFECVKDLPAPDTAAQLAENLRISCECNPSCTDPEEYDGSFTAPSGVSTESR